MMNDYAVNLNTVLTAECPQGITIDQFKKKIVSGELTLSSSAQATILAYAEPLKTYGTQFATVKNLTVITDAEKIFLSSFVPSTAINSSGNLIEGTTLDGLTALEMWTCAIETCTANGCSPFGVVGGNKTNIGHLTKTVTTILTSHASTIGVAILMNGFGDCLSTFQASDSFLREMSLQEVLNKSPRTMTILNGLLNETVANEYTIDSTSVSRIATTDGRVSYTFAIVPKPEDTFFQNVVIQTGRDGVVYNFIAQYEDTNDGVVETDSTAYSFENEKVYPITSLPTTYSRLGLSLRGSGRWCITIGYNTDKWVEKCKNNLTGTHTTAPECYDDQNNRIQIKIKVFVILASACGDSGGGGSPGGPGGSTGGTGGSSGSWGSSGGGSSGGGSSGNGTGGSPSSPEPVKSAPQAPSNQLVTSPTVPVPPDPDCKTSKEDLKAMFPSLTDAKATQLANTINKYAKKFGINNKEKLQHFLAQASVESDYFTKSEENPNYQPKYAAITFKDFFNPIGKDGANPKKKNLSDFTTFIGPISGKVFIDTESLFNYVYQDENRVEVGWSKIGNDQPGDGFKYMGRGFLQLTGKDNYTSFTNWYQKNVDANLNFKTNPELIATDFEIGIMASLWYFKNKVMPFVTIDSNTSSYKVTPFVNVKGLKKDERDKNFTKSKIIIKCN